MAYLFRNEGIDDDWRKCLYIDIETVDGKDEFSIENLDIRRAKHLCIGLYKEHDVKPEIRGLKRLEREDKVFYLLHDANYEHIAMTILHFIDITGLTNIVAHNGNHFDFLVLKGFVNFKNYSGNLFFMHPNGKTIRCIDTVKIARACGKPSLNEFSKLFTGLEKLQDGDFMDYLINDVYILMKTCERLSELEIAFTPTRTARRAIYDALSKPVYTIWRGAYPYDLVGGRSQVFRFKHEDTGYVYDFNSLYPSVMAYHYFPAFYEGEKAWVIKPRPCDIERLIKAIKSVRMVIKTLLEGELKLIREFITHAYPFQDFHIMKVRIKGISKEFERYTELIKRYFPFPGLTNYGKRHYSWTGEVYTIAGMEVLFLSMFEYELIEVVCYPHSRLPISKTISDFYRLRQELKKAKDMRETLYKIIMNAGYGIFGLKRDKHDSGIVLTMEEASGIVDELHSHPWISIERLERNPLYCYAYDSQQKAWLEMVERPDGMVEVVISFIRQFSYHSIPPVAIGIAANARAWLYLHMLWLANMGYEIFYTDTDSIHTNARPEVLKDFISDGMLDLKHEKTFQKALYLLPKTYSLWTDDTVIIHHKAVGSDLEREMVIQSIKKDFQIITRRFLSEDSIPAYIPDEKLYAMLNTNGIKIKNSIPYKNLLMEYISSHSRLKEELSSLNHG